MDKRKVLGSSGDLASGGARGTQFFLVMTVNENLLFWFGAVFFILGVVMKHLNLHSLIFLPWKPKHEVPKMALLHEKDLVEFDVELKYIGVVYYQHKFEMWNNQNLTFNCSPTKLQQLLGSEPIKYIAIFGNILEPLVKLLFTQTRMRIVCWHRPWERDIIHDANQKIW